MDDDKKILNLTPLGYGFLTYPKGVRLWPPYPLPRRGTGGEAQGTGYRGTGYRVQGTGVQGTGYKVQGMGEAPLFNNYSLWFPYPFGVQGTG